MRSAAPSTVVRTVLAAAALAATSFACYSMKTVPSGEEPEVPAVDDDDGEDGDGEDGDPDRTSDAGLDSGPTADASPDPPKVCTPELCPPEVLLEGLQGPVTIALDSAYYYWAEVMSTLPGGWGQLARLPKAGPTCTDRSCFDVIDDKLNAGELEGRAYFNTQVESGPSHVCITQSYNASPSHTISCFSKLDFERTSLHQGDGLVVDLRLGPTGAWWVVLSTLNSWSIGNVQGKLFEKGSSVTTYGAARPGPTGVTIDNKDVYWTELGDSSNDGRVLVNANGKINELAKDRSRPVSPRVFGTYVYWIESAERKILRAPVDSKGPAELIATTEPHPFELAVDESGVYWACVGPGASGTNGSVAHAPLTPGGVTTVMMTGLHDVSDIAVDAVHVYVTTLGAVPFDNGKIIRVKKRLSL